MAANKTRIRKWLKALRSGKYKQGQEYLRPAKDEFCCLGVACDIFSKEAKEGKWKIDEYRRVYEFAHKTLEYNEEAHIPKVVAEWFGISANQNKLMNMNDIGKSFEQIANFIEKRYLTK